MKTGEHHDTDPRWGALAPLSAGVIALLLFAAFIGFWAQQRLISGVLPAQGTLVLHLDGAEFSNAPPGNLAVVVRLVQQDASRVAEGQSAVLRLRSVSGLPPRDLTAEVTGIIRTDGYLQVRIQPVAGQLPKIEALPLLHGSPVEVTILTGERSVLALLLDPVIGMFSTASRATPTNGT